MRYDDPIKQAAFHAWASAFNGGVDMSDEDVQDFECEYSQTSDARPDQKGDIQSLPQTGQA